MATPELLVVCRVHRAHGLKGEVSAEAVTAFPERLRPGVTLIWQRDSQPERRLTLTAVRPHGKRLLLSFDGVADADAARALGGGDLCVAGSESFPAPEGFFYSHEIEGFACIDPARKTSGRCAGRGRDRRRVLCFRCDWPPGWRPWCPSSTEYVAIDREARTIVLDLPEGLLGAVLSRGRE